MVKLNYMKLKNGMFIWKQVEKVGSKVFMRAKKRPMVIIREVVS